MHTESYEKDPPTIIPEHFQQADRSMLFRQCPGWRPYLQGLSPCHPTYRTPHLHSHIPGPAAVRGNDRHNHTRIGHDPAGDSTADTSPEHPPGWSSMVCTVRGPHHWKKKFKTDVTKIMHREMSYAKYKNHNAPHGRHHKRARHVYFLLLAPRTTSRPSTSIYQISMYMSRPFMRYPYMFANWQSVMENTSTAEPRVAQFKIYGAAKRPGMTIWKKYFHSCANMDIMPPMRTYVWSSAP